VAPETEGSSSCSQESDIRPVQVRGSTEHFVTGTFLRWGLLAPAQPPSWKATPCRLSATAYSIYSQLPSISGDRLPHPQPEDAPCRRHLLFYISNVCEQNTNYRHIVRKRLFNLRASEQSQLHTQKCGGNFFKRFVQMCSTDNRNAIIINSINLWRNKLQIVLSISKVTTKQCVLIARHKPRRYSLPLVYVTISNFYILLHQIHNKPGLCLFHDEGVS
jgi:hypothetical protein